MNTQDAYDRDPDRRLAEPAPLAVHHDPSQHAQNGQATGRPRNGVAWVRPSDLPTMLGSKVIGRGLDLRAELVRRASRPTRPQAPKEPVTKTAIAETEPPSITHTRPGGISL